MTVNNGYNSLYTTMVETGKTGDNYNWGNKSATETASEYGYYFMDQITCDGAGSITSPSSKWTTVKNTYNNLTTNVQGECWTAAASESGNNIEKAMYRYDYIVFFKKYSGYDDFINRATNTSGKAFTINNFKPFELIVNEENSISTIIIIIASSVSLLSITALSVLMVKKRKSKEQ